MRKLVFEKRRRHPGFRLRRSRYDLMTCLSLIAVMIMVLMMR